MDTQSLVNYLKYDGGFDEEAYLCNMMMMMMVMRIRTMMATMSK